MNSSATELKPIEEASLDQDYIMTINLEQPKLDQRISDKFLIAMSFLELNQGEESEKRLRLIQAQNPESYSDEIDFYLIKSNGRFLEIENPQMEGIDMDFFLARKYFF